MPTHTLVAQGVAREPLVREEDCVIPVEFYCSVGQKNPVTKDVAMAQIGKVLGAVGCVASLLMGCNSADDNSYVRPTGRGSTACQAWQKAVCDFAAVRCGIVAETVCVDTYYSITCNSDATAQSCTSAIQAATCTTGLPAGCNIDDLVDPAPAVTACDNLLTAVCNKVAECGGGTVEACVTKQQTQTDCSTAVGYTARYEVCLSDVSKMTCTTASQPASCENVIKIN